MLFGDEKMKGRLFLIKLNFNQPIITKEESCCVFCSYGLIICPATQEKEELMDKI